MSDMDPPNNQNKSERAESHSEPECKLGSPSQVKLVLTRSVSRDSGFPFLKRRGVLLLLCPVGVSACSA